MNAHFKNKTSVSRGEFLGTALVHFALHPDMKFTAATGLEELRLNEFNATKTDGATIFTTLEDVARELGLNPDGTFGGLSRTVHLDQQDAHKLGCACNGEEVTGAEMVGRIRRRLHELR